MTKAYKDTFEGQRLIGYVVLSLCLCVSVVQTPAQQWRTVADGVEHAQVRREFSGKPVDINLLRLDLTKVRLDVHHAMDMAIGTEKTSSIATRHGAFAAINGGFFRLDVSPWAGDASELLIVDNKLLSDSVNRRIALGILNGNMRTKVEIGHFKVGVGILNGSRLISTMFAVNRERKPGSLIVYTPEFGPTTLTDDKGIEVIVRNTKLGTRQSILEFRDSLGNSTIPRDGFVISLTGKVSIEAEVLHALTYRTQRVQFSPVVGTGDRLVGRNEIEDVVAGVPQLIKNGKIDITWEQEKASKSFVETRHPRTAVAKLKDGKFLMLTADGRTDESAGLDLYDLAKYMLELGAVDAMNLDGGGSTTMFLDGKVVNKPSDPTGERKIGDAILVTLRKKKNL